MEQFPTNKNSPDLEKIRFISQEEAVEITTRLTSLEKDRVSMIDRLSYRKAEIEATGASDVAILNLNAFEGNEFNLDDPNDLSRAIQQQIYVIVRNSQIMKDVADRNTTFIPDSFTNTNTLEIKDTPASNMTVIAIAVTFGILIFVLLAALSYLVLKDRFRITILKSTERQQSKDHLDHSFQSKNSTKDSEIYDNNPIKLDIRTTRETSAFTLSTNRETSFV